MVITDTLTVPGLSPVASGLMTTISPSESLTIVPGFEPKSTVALARPEPVSVTGVPPATGPDETS